MLHQKVIQGKDDWLFLNNDSNNALQQITGSFTFSERRLAQWQFVLEARYLWLREKGIPYFFLVAPNKECVYPEYLPEGIQLSSSRCINQLNQYLEKHSFFRIVYPLFDLEAAKNKLPVYRRQDTHWNAFGAFVAYQALMKEITKVLSIPTIYLSSLDFCECSKAGDLGTKLDIPHETTLDVAFLNSKDSNCTADNQVKNRGNLLIFEHKNKNLPRAVMFRDSFAIELLPFIAESFSRLVVSWQPNIDYMLIKSEDPDIVISQQVERYLIDIPNDSHGLTNTEIVKEKKDFHEAQ